MRGFYEFFAGGGMARAGIGAGWRCLFANDLDPKKAAAYTANWGGEHLFVGDVTTLDTKQLPGHADLAWASFPCQDLSLAGSYVGLNGARSGTFWPFWKLMTSLLNEGRAPRVIVLENVYGALTSNGGADFHAIGSALANADYTFGAMVMDARHWVPQSRPRLFFVGVRSDVATPTRVQGDPCATWHPKALMKAVDGMPRKVRDHWVWWKLPIPAKRNTNFIDIIEDEPTGCDWRNQRDTNHFISLMSPRNLEKLEDAIRETKANHSRMVGGAYRRTRNGQQRVEIRFDDISGCLRTPRGGSSRQSIFLIENGRLRSRLLSAREAARLMGLPDGYQLPDRYNDAYHLCGDGVAVPVVRHLVDNLVNPILDSHDNVGMAAAE
ncbi:MAG: DNA cytosine methyltransferase [Alphaproteobacteria bacterium]|nr:DNA cytosine methyltransferase [Alphaproteobacteria bacterium]